MRVLATLVIALALIVSFWTGADAQEGKEVTIKGRITCCKCDFDTVKVGLGEDAKKPKGCVTVIVAKKGDKATVYIFDKASHKKYHSDICTTPKDGRVTGTVTTKGDQKIIAVKDLEYK